MRSGSARSESAHSVSKGWHSKHIVCGNALRLDWNDVLPAEDCDYIIGNPPFKGAHAHPPRTSTQTAELKEAFDNAKGIGEADYVAAWFSLAAKYLKACDSDFAFVATNSITQGQQPGLIWPTMLDGGWRISFAYKPFLWGSEMANQAAVGVTIIGATKRNCQRRLFDTDYQTGEVRGIEFVGNINPYLVVGTDMVVLPRKTPLCDVPGIGIGNKPIDGGNYLFTQEEMEEFVKTEPGSSDYFHDWLGSDEFINAKRRYVLWLGDATDEEIDRMPKCREIVERVREYRSQSSSAGTRKLAEKPTRFHVDIRHDPFY